MFPKISRFVTIAALTTLTCVLNPPSDARASDVELMAQSRYNSPEVVEPEVTLTFPELVEKTFHYHSGDFFEKSSISGFLDSMLGLRGSLEGSYPENSIARDGFLLNVIMSDYFKQLQEGSPRVRTRDMDSPFRDSLRTNPDYLIP
ncbi:hypothetical protein AA637_10640 [Cyanobacterium sp. HL-69]|uniref:hypothetical protein n=1 Tax=unclassified Cyanobacterium TaxID=2629879 RepID=UPI0008525EDE|nr:hypothetical protein [Cyanobacterium sp. IPPAS B-1200]AUC61570.1 hypothetical protein AA637_10640 [Cyanobacterium sp. HL-69]OEJ78277.1 hypothetical protein A5482_03305 [Cyanobacterium sp. IPPAS B-1200]